MSKKFAKKKVESINTEGQVLTPKQLIFVNEYATHMDANRAAKAAGFSRKEEPKRLMKKKHILDAINLALANKGVFAEPTAQRVLQELMAIAFFDPKDLLNDDGSPRALSDIPENARRCIAGIEFAMEGKGEDAVTVKKIKITDKHKALENIGRYLAMFTDKLKLDVPAQLDNMDDEQLRTTVRALAEATGIIDGSSEASKTKH